MAVIQGENSRDESDRDIHEGGDQHAESADELRAKKGIRSKLKVLNGDIFRTQVGFQFPCNNSSPFPFLGAAWQTGTHLVADCLDDIQGVLGIQAGCGFRRLTSFLSNSNSHTLLNALDSLVFTR